MLTVLKKYSKIIIASMLMLAFVATPLSVSAAPINDACDGLAAAGQTCGTGNDGFKNIIGSIINILSVIVGAVSVIMIIIGGFRYVVSNGDSNGIQGAKNTILYAIVGLVVVVFAQLIVAFVLDRATAVPTAPAAPAKQTRVTRSLS